MSLTIRELLDQLVATGYDMDTPTSVTRIRLHPHDFVRVEVLSKADDEDLKGTEDAVVRAVRDAFDEMRSLK